MEDDRGQQREVSGPLVDSETGELLERPKEEPDSNKVLFVAIVSCLSKLYSCSLKSG